eukprot:6111616-Prymnesium_polylepis.1
MVMVKVPNMPPFFSTHTPALLCTTPSGPGRLASRLRRTLRRPARFSVRSTCCRTPTKRASGERASSRARSCSPNASNCACVRLASSLICASLSSDQMPGQMKKSGPGGMLTSRRLAPSAQRVANEWDAQNTGRTTAVWRVRVTAHQGSSARNSASLSGRVGRDPYTRRPPQPGRSARPRRPPAWPRWWAR